MDNNDLRAVIREVLRDLLPAGISDTETVNLSTDADLAAFVDRLLSLDPGEREEIRAGRKRFRLAAPAPAGPSRPAAPPDGVRRIDKGAVTEAIVKKAAQAGERLVLGRAAVLTPLAAERARAAGVRIDRLGER